MVLLVINDDLDVSVNVQAPGVPVDDGMKHAAVNLPRSEFETSTFGTNHYHCLPHAAIDEQIKIVLNVRS